ncbi:hypothetical protein F3Y22_tig00112488pilonHSYRG00077 [Hibiscus syriacus]|uniref:Uncharacterized protein n=1 Tax=Hibiscus syriacus TaxID=106335 RepID=A0A6A2Y3R5_HIBSY|nr:hypothetical protein F3Y22_tig00112488pilonHSYRG00077 [Hibiscus syriacus]
MEERLSNAAMEGDIESLSQLLQEDPLILHRSIVSCSSDTPLHVSSMLGHLSFVQHLLSLNSELDSRGCSALHLAAAKGYLQIVKELVKAEPEMLVGLKSLIELNRKDDEMVNHKDCEGNTLVHIAVANKQIEIIKFLLTIPGLNANAMNNNGCTALYTLKQSPRALRDLEIESILRDAGALSSNDLHVVAVDSESTEDSSDTKVSVAYQAAISPPGGVLQVDETVDDERNPLEHPRKAGTAWATDKETEMDAGSNDYLVDCHNSTSDNLLYISKTYVTGQCLWYASLCNPDIGAGMVGTYGVVFVGNVVRMNLWALRKYGFLKEKNAEPFN